MNRNNRTVSFILATALAIAAVSVPAFAQTAQKPVTLKVGANPIPHADLLNLVKADLLAQGIKLEIVEITDYVTPNLLLAEKQL
ncbi:MAG: MetQ/NlpA family ABC transporter substrate-binding protein, partial [Candidatus Hydrogenedentales bacterium]